MSTLQPGVGHLADNMGSAPDGFGGYQMGTGLLCSVSNMPTLVWAGDEWEHQQARSVLVSVEWRRCWEPKAGGPLAQPRPGIGYPPNG
jgi:hypothetical protein